MAYLRLFDYYRAIQDAQLQQVITSNDSIRSMAEIEAQAEAVSYLTQKYDTDKEFTDTLVWNNSATYYAGNLVELNYSDYDSTHTYSTGNLVVYSGSAYICTGATTSEFSPASWTLLGLKYDLLYVTYPQTEFNYKTYYNKGDKVFWKNKVYTCAIATTLMSQQDALQYRIITNIPIPNVFPDDPVNGLQYWGVGVAYSVTPGTLPTDTTKWTKGDNRSAQLVHKVIDVCLYNLHSRIAPKNIPQLRMDRYAAAIAWLDMAKAGEITADIPLKQPKTDGRIRYGGDVRRINSY